MKRFVLALLCCVPCPAFAAADLACVQEIKDVFINSTKGGHFIVETKLDWEPGSATTVAEFAPPDRMHSVAVTASGTTETTLADGKLWIEFNDRLTEMPASSAQAYLKAFNEGPFTEAMTFVAANCSAGSVSLFGIKLRQYTYTIDMAGSVVDFELSVDANTGLPARLITSMVQMDKPSLSTANYRYGVSVTISPPTP
jgi:hypothetical protein